MNKNNINNINKIKNNYLTEIKDLPIEYLTWRLDLSTLYKKDHNERNVLNKKLIKIVEDYGKTKVFNLFLSGNTYLGKTRRIIALCNELILKYDIKVLYFNFETLIRMNNAKLDKFGKFNDEEAEHWKEQLLLADVVVFDDFNYLDYKFMGFVSYVFDVIKQRMNINKSCVFVSNYAINDLQKKYSAKFNDDAKYCEIFFERLKNNLFNVQKNGMIIELSSKVPNINITAKHN